MTSRRQLAFVFLGAVIARLAFYRLTGGYAVDDAFVVFRYAENIAAGHGFVYNLGDRVQGTWGPLYTFLLAILSLLQIPAKNAALLIGLFCSSLTAVLIFRFGLMLRFARLAFLPALLYMVWPASLTADISGTEVALFTLLVVSTLYYHHRRRYVYAVGLATLAVLARPEGIILLIMLGVSGCHHDRASIRPLTYTPLLLLVPWLVFAFLYFGSIVPRPLTVDLLYHGFVSHWTFWKGLASVLGLDDIWGWLLLPFVLAGLYWLSKKQNFGRLETAWLIISIVFYAFIWHTELRHGAAAIYPLIIIFVSAAVIWFREAVSTRHYLILPAGLATAGIVALFAIFVTHYVVHLHQVHTDLREGPRLAGVYLNRHADVRKDVAAVDEVGYVGYYSKMRVIDREGVVSPEVVPYNAKGLYLQAILDFKPEWVGSEPRRFPSEMLSDTLFTRLYHLEITYAADTPYEYRLYRRSDVATRQP